MSEHTREPDRPDSNTTLYGRQLAIPDQYRTTIDALYTNQHGFVVRLHNGITHRISDRCDECDCGDCSRVAHVETRHQADSHSGPAVSPDMTLKTELQIRDDARCVHATAAADAIQSFCRQCHSYYYACDTTSLPHGHVRIDTYYCTDCGYELSVE